MSSSNYMSGQANSDIVEGLTKVLADTFVLYFKTHSCHWNVEGAQFQQLHELFSVQYTEMWTVADDIAERIRALDAYAPTSYRSLLGKATLKEESDNLNADAMIGALAEGHTQIVSTIYPVINLASEAGDEVTVGLLTDRVNVHEKTAWMLRSLLK